MCFVRKALDRVFSQRELKWLDDIMPEIHKKEKEDKTKKILAQIEQVHVHPLTQYWRAILPTSIPIIVHPKNLVNMASPFQNKASTTLYLQDYEEERRKNSVLEQIEEEVSSLVVRHW